MKTFSQRRFSAIPVTGSIPVILILTFTILLSGCFPTFVTRNEKYIKNTIQHREGGMDRITLTKIRSGHLGPGADVFEYEITGYVYNGKKGVVIGTARKEIPLANNNLLLVRYDIDHIELTKADCDKILTSYQELLSNLRNATPHGAQEIYADLKINDNLYISFSRKNGKPYSNRMALWVNGKKVVVDRYKFILALTKFEASASHQ